MEGRNILDYFLIFGHPILYVKWRVEIGLFVF